MTEKVIFFDIDSTLLDYEKQLPASTKVAIGRLQDEGHTVAIATGRAPFAFEQLREELNIDTYVSLNGQYVVYKNEVIYKNPLDMDSLARLHEVSRENGHPLVYLDHENWSKNVNDHPHIHASISSLKIDRAVRFDPAYYQGRDIYQTLLFCTEGNEKSYVEAFDKFHFIRWHDYSVDVLPSGGSKAIGIEKAMDIVGAKPEHVYAFGDGLNDIEMLKFVQNSVAMGNAHDSVKKAAKHITKNVDDDGVLHGLELVGLLK